MRKRMLKWPSVLLAGISGLIICLPTAMGAPLVSPLASSDSPVGGEVCPAREMLTEHLRNLGFEQNEISRRLDGLSEKELERLAFSSEPALAGGETEAGKAAGVALVILITVGAITGFYLFYNANR